MQHVNIKLRAVNCCYSTSLIHSFNSIKHPGYARYVPWMSRSHGLSLKRPQARTADRQVSVEAGAGARTIHQATAAQNRGQSLQR